MGKYRIEISNIAKQDIRSITKYITADLQEPAIAEKTADAIIDAILTLEEMPERIRLVNDPRLAQIKVRGLQIKNYTAFFRIDEAIETVEIIRVLYSRRDWQSVLLAQWVE